MKRIAAGLIFLIAGASGASAQIVSNADTVRFGTFREADGPVSKRVYVTNTSPRTLSILKVRPTCGCTAADFQKDPVAPGDSAWIDLSYNPYRRPGHFEKGVKVYPSEGEMIRIPITGTVIASDETIAHMYPSQAGLLNISEKEFMPLVPVDNDNKTIYADIYNSTSSPVWTIVDTGTPAVETETFPSPVPPGEKGLIGIYLRPEKEQRTGPIEYTLLLYTTDSDPSDIPASSIPEPTVLTIRITKP